MSVEVPRIDSVKTLVLDSNELARDFTCASLRYQLLEHSGGSPWVEVLVPAVVFEETIANYGRALSKAAAASDLTERERRRLGLDVLGPLAGGKFRDYLEERFDDRLGITVLPWPDVSHADLVKRAVTRTPPFNASGGGYRDSLVWADVLELARRGREVVLVSSDKIFAGPEGNLADQLSSEVLELAGAVELARELGPWLLEALPWSADGMPEAVKSAQDREVYEYFLTSDIQGDLAPEVVDLGFERSPYSVQLDEVRWEGTFTRVSTSVGPDGLYIAEYDLDETVSLSATFSGLDVRGDVWVTSATDTLGQVVLEGDLPMVLRMVVLFGGDVSFSIEEIGWRRADGVGQGVDVYRPEWDRMQPSFFSSASPTPR